MNPDPGGTRHARTRSKMATGNWRAIAEGVATGPLLAVVRPRAPSGQSRLIQPSGLFDRCGESLSGAMTTNPRRLAGEPAVPPVSTRDWAPTSARYPAKGPKRGPGRYGPLDFSRKPMRGVARAFQPLRPSGEDRVTGGEGIDRHLFEHAELRATEAPEGPIPRPRESARRRSTRRLRPRGQWPRSRCRFRGSVYPCA